MFQSEAICVLTAGPTIDGRHIEQSVIDDIAQTYSPTTYNARINEDHWSWGPKFGSVLSVEKRDNELWAVLKPNSLLLDTIERGQLLHTSCEITPNFAGTGKNYLSGLALTDEPASLGTTEMHLSADSKDKGRTLFSTGATVGFELLEHEKSEQDPVGILARIKQMLSANAAPSTQSTSPTQEEDTMDKETKTMLAAQSEQLSVLGAGLVKLTAAIEGMSAAPATTVATQADNAASTDAAELSGKVDALSTKFDDVVTKLGSITDETDRALAGVDGELADYL